MGKHEKENSVFLSQNARAWLYRVAVAALPLLALYGYLDSQAVPVWASFFGYLFLNGVAVANTPIDKGE